jgi:hypothetical protein
MALPRRCFNRLKIFQDYERFFHRVNKMCQRYIDINVSSLSKEKRVVVF